MTTTSTTAKRNRGLGPLSIWQYILLGGPAHTRAAFSSAIFKHKENYIDITSLGNAGIEEDYGGFCVDNRLPMERYGPMEDVEGGSVDKIFHTAYPDSTSVRPTILSLSTLVVLGIQLCMGIVSGMVFTLDIPKNPYLMFSLVGFTTILFFVLVISSFYYWAIESDHKAYVPLIVGNGMGFSSHVLLVLLYVFWVIDASGLETNVLFKDHSLLYIKFAIVSSIHVVLAFGTVVMYGNSIISGYQWYRATFEPTRVFIAEQNKTKRRDYASMVGMSSAGTPIATHSSHVQTYPVAEDTGGYSYWSYAHTPTTGMSGIPHHQYTTGYAPYPKVPVHARMTATHQSVDTEKKNMNKHTHPTDDVTQQQQEEEEDDDDDYESSPFD